MEATVVSVGKTVLDGALGYARSKAAEEVALQLGVEGDVAFITDELEMIQSFLMTADEERGQHKVLATWVKQVRDVSYNVEDSLMDFALYSDKKISWWCSLHTMVERRHIAKEVKELRAKVEDVSNRNLRYRLIKESSGSKPSVAEEQASIASAAMFGINEARLADLEKEKSKVDLHQLITTEEEELRVIAVWGTSGDLGKTSAIQEVYDDPKVLKKFGFCAWIRLMHPFNPQEFLRSLVRQFYENSLDDLGKGEEGTSIGANVLMKMEKMQQNELVHVFNAQVSSHSYLIVIDDLSTIVEWHCIKKYFPDNKKHSRIIVSTQQVEIASLCTEKPYQVSELKQLSSDQTLYLFHKNVIPTSGSAASSSNSIKATTIKNIRAVSSDQIREEDQEPKDAGGKVSTLTNGKKFRRCRTIALADELITGRVTEQSEVIELIGRTEDEEVCKVITVWGMGGLGKTTLVRSIYGSEQLGGWKRAWATASHPFNPEVLIRSLVLQLLKDVLEDPAGATATDKRKEKIGVMKLQALKEELIRLLSAQKCLIVLDDISSTAEWDLAKNCLENARRVVVITREKNIAKHCSNEYKNMYSLEGLKDDDALGLFKRKVFKDNSEDIVLVPDMMMQAKFVLKKCDGLPLAILTIGGFLASRPKTVVEWRKMNNRISSELEINPELRRIKTVLMRSYDGLPYHLKSAFLYLCIFPQDRKIRWDRLVKRWTAEGYSRDMNGMTAEELGRKYFEELLDRSMVLPGEEVNHYNGKINYCQLHDIIREICISKAREENLVFTLEEGCFLSSKIGAIRHLVIGSNWERDKDVFKSMLDLSHVRSLTVFGEWRPFFISDKMRFLRVLDLEDTLGLRDHHLDQIGQLRHLMYLSLRECTNIHHLPNSLGSLRHLQTLDVRGTHIVELPSAIVMLQKLQHLHATAYRNRRTGSWNRRDNLKGEKLIEHDYTSYTGCFLPCESCRILLFAGHLLLKPQVFYNGLNRHDMLNLYRYRTALNRVEVPRGIGKLKALHTLAYFHVAWGKGKATLKELKELTQLRKLGLAGFNDGNIKELWSAIAGHNQLRSLSVEMNNWWYELDDCLGEGLSPPGSLESLRLYGKLVRVTDWIHQLQNLSKLTLAYTRLEQDDAIQALGAVPNLAVLRLKRGSFLGKQFHFQGLSFPSLVLLEIDELEDPESVSFEEHAMPRLELLQVSRCMWLKEISGLSVLTSLKEIRFGGYVPAELKEEAQRQVAEHLKHVRVNIT